MPRRWWAVARIPAGGQSVVIGFRSPYRGQQGLTSSLVTHMTRRESAHSTFADDTELGDVANTSNGFVAIQGDLNRLEKRASWSSTEGNSALLLKAPSLLKPWHLHLVQWQMSCLTAATSFSKTLENSSPRSNLPLKTQCPEGLIITWNRVSLQQNIVKANLLCCEISGYLSSQNTCHWVM